MNGKKSDEATAPTSDRILDAADTLFCERGFDGVSVRDVAERAHVNKASVFYHYGNKGALFERVLERYYQSHMGVLQRALEGEGSGRERLHVMLDAYFDFMAENVRYASLVQHHVGSEEARGLIKARLGPLIIWMAQTLAVHTPGPGHLSSSHLLLSFGSMVVSYFTYAPLLEEVWGGAPMKEAALAERRAHLHWMMDTVLDGLGKLETAEMPETAGTPGTPGTPGTAGTPGTPRTPGMPEI